MPSFYQKLTQGVLIAGCIIAAAPPAWATSFTISSGETVTAVQTLVDGETGLIESGGFLNTTATSITGGGNAVITNNGTITTTGDSSTGLTPSGSGNVIINNGTINTSGVQADGLRDGGTNTLFTNNGSIITTGDSAEGILTTRSDSVYNNAGLIDTSGDASVGIITSGDNEVINNSGTIITRGASAHGIRGNVALALTVTNSGTIRTRGASSAGITVNRSAAITNSGLISAEQSATAAIIGSEEAETVNLLSGSQIIGTIDLNGATDIVNISGANNSSTLTLTDTETINLLNGNGLLVGDVVTMVDPTGQSVSSAVLSTTTFAVHNVVNQRLAHHQPLKPIQVATSELTSGMVFQERAPQIWGSALGEMRERDLEGIALGYDHNYVGFTGGYEASFYKARIGLLGGFVRSTVKTTGDKFGRVRSVDTDTDSFFVGAYGQYFLGGLNLTTTLMAGYEDHENDRAVVDNLNGFETAQADFSSFFISPSLTLSSAYNVGTEVELRPSVTLAYSGGWYDDYAESGTTRSDLVIDDRNAHALTGQLQLAAAYSLAEESELEFRAGAKARYTDNDDIDVNLAGTDFRIPNASDDSVYGGYLGVNIRVAIKESINLVADVEHGRAGGGEEHIAAMLKLEAVFN
jgi:outer membrane autotransporter protein